MSLGVVEYREGVVRPIGRPRAGTIVIALGLLAGSVVGGFLADRLHAKPPKPAVLAWSGNLPKSVAPSAPVSAIVRPLASEAPAPRRPKFNAATYDLLFGPSVQATTFLRPTTPGTQTAEAPRDVPPAVALATPRVPEPEAQDQPDVVPMPAPRMAEAEAQPETPDDIIPIPTPNPFRSRALVRTDQPPRDPTPRRVVAAVAPKPEEGNFFQRLFGGLSDGNSQSGNGRALAYARSEDPGLRATNPVVPRLAPGDSARTAVYDINAGMVYMPNGEKLEAHSGLGPHFDDPRAVSIKNRGPTPPNTYELSMREQLFHGVRALRMTPVDGSRMFGRDGILAHTYMLGPRGDSNGCVSFRNYDQFLQAYLRGEVKRLVVVTNSGQSVLQRIAQSRI